MAYDKKRLDTLIRQGMMPAKSLPILHRALDKLKKGTNLTPYEREGISKLMDKVMGFQFGDDVTYNRARLHTQRTRYQTEEKKVANKDKEGDIIVHDGSEDESEKVKKNAKSKLLKTNKGDGMKPEEEIKEASASRPADKDIGDKESPKQGSSVKPEITDGPKQDSKPSIKEGLISDLDSEGMRARASRLGKRKGRVSKEKMAKELPAALRREKQKAGLSEDMAKFNELYKENLERALANNNVDNVRDIPVKIKSDLFKHVEEATYSDKQIKMAKGIAFDPRHKGGDYSGAAKKAEKIKKGLSDHPAVSNALRRANEELELGLDEGSLKNFAMDHGYDFDNPPKNPDSWLAKKAIKHGIGPKAKDILKSKTAKPAAKPVKESKMATKDHDGDGKIESGKDEYFGSKDKAIKKALKKVPDMKKVNEEEETEHQAAVKKAFSPNQAIRDVHQAVVDVMMGGHTAQVSDVPLVTDPSMELNKGTGNHFDTPVEDVQEGAKEDAMRDIKRDKGHGMAPLKKDPKPGKSKHDGSENKGPDHIVAQLRKAISLGDKHDGVKFQDGKTHKVKAHHAHKFLNKYMSGKPADKEKMQSHGHANHDNFKTHID
jgi:hypothetical protein